MQNVKFLPKYLHFIKIFCIFAPQFEIVCDKYTKFVRQNQIFYIPKKYENENKTAQPLTFVEQQVCNQYAFGLTDKEVSDRLCKSLSTIKTHKRNIFRKLKINTTHEMVIFAICAYLNINWSPKIVRQKGLSIFASKQFLCHPTKFDSIPCS